MMISVVEMVTRDWPPASAFHLLGLCGNVGELLAFERRNGTLRAAKIQPDIAGNDLDFRPFEQPQHRLAIGGGRGDVILDSRVKNRLRSRVRSLGVGRRDYRNKGEDDDENRSEHAHAWSAS